MLTVLLIFKNMKAKTRNQFEQELNQSLSENYSFDAAMDKFIYLTNKCRGNSCSLPTLQSAYHNETLGTLLRRLDQTAFNQAFSDGNY